MRQHFRYLAFFFLLSSYCLFGGNLWGQNGHYYSYLNEDGVQVYTNIPPVNNFASLRIGGIPPAMQSPSVPENRKTSFSEIIEKYAANYGIDPFLIHSIIETESGFNPRAVSPKGAQGLMQLMPETAKRLGVTNSFDPEQNIHGGIRHFRFLMDSFNNDLELSLAAYNAGENLVQRLGRVPEIKETKEYVQAVTTRYAQKTMERQEQEGEKHPPAYRFVDESGILHLTNIYPSR